MSAIEVDEGTYRSVQFAARMAGISAGEVVGRLVAQSAAPATLSKADDGAPDPGQMVPIYANYEGQRTQARFDAHTHRVEIMTGPLAGQSYKTPSGAAIAVVRHYKPTVNPNRNGWGFWTLDDGSGCLLQTLR